MTTAPGLKIGVDVPWISSWSLEQQTGVSPCPSVDGQLAVGQQNKPGAGEPLYARAHLFRQRKSVREMLCPMCGEHTPDDDRWSQTARPTTARALRSKGLGPTLPADMPDDQALLDCGTIAPMHRACAEAASGLAHLADMNERELKRFPKAWIIAPLWIEARSPKPQAKSVAVVSYLQLLGVEGE